MHFELLRSKSVTAIKGLRGTHGLYNEKIEERKVMINTWQWLPHDFKCALSVIYRGWWREVMETRPK